jgi:hypothetical protein
MGFSNSVVGGAETLIRTAIKSLGYVLNTTGWRIARDGSADLANASLRGSLVVNGSNSSSITISNPGGNPEIDLRPPNIPAYPAFNSTIVAGSLTAVSNNGGSQNASTTSIALTAPTINGRPTTGIDFTSASYDGVSSKPTIHVGAAASGVDLTIDGPNSNLSIGGQGLFSDTLTALLDTSVGTDLTIGNTLNFAGNPLDAGKGVIALNGRNTDTGIATGATEGSVTSRGGTFIAGRAYKVTCSGIGQITAGAPSRMFLRVRKTNTTGTLLAQSAEAIGNNSTPSGVDFVSYFWVDPSGGNIVDAVSWSMITGIVGVSCQVIGATSPATIQIEDIGPYTRINGWAAQFI